MQRYVGVPERSEPLTTVVGHRQTLKLIHNFIHKPPIYLFHLYTAPPPLPISDLGLLDTLGKVI